MSIGRSLISIALLAHGLSHVLFLMNAWGYWKVGRQRSWLIAGVFGASQQAEGLLGLLWLVPLVGFAVLAWGVLLQRAWWRPLALAIALLSLVMIVLWRGSLPPSSALFAALFDIGIIAVVSWQREMALHAGA